MKPRIRGAPRPVSEPSSDSASAKPMLMPAPMDAARPTRKVSQLLCVAKAAANSGASVETEPSIRPARPGCTYCSTNMRRLVASSSAFASPARWVSASWPAFFSWPRSISARRVSSSRTDTSSVWDGGLVVELGRLHLHDLGFLPHLLDAERLAEPDRAALQEPFHVLAPDGRKMLAKASRDKGYRAWCGARAPPRPFRRTSRRNEDRPPAPGRQRSGRCVNPLPRLRWPGPAPRARSAREGSSAPCRSPAKSLFGIVLMYCGASARGLATRLARKLARGAASDP